MDFIQEVCDWNRERGNTEFDQVLEVRMLDEEFSELIDAYVDVDIADALADIIFVAVGSLFKLTGGDEQKVKDILLAVSAANNLKGSSKVGGKVTKPKDFKGPEEMIRRILEDVA